MNRRAMQAAPGLSIPTEEEISLWDAIRVRKGLEIDDVGGCNACKRRDGYKVTEVTFRGLSMRFCDKCSKTIKEQL